MEKAKNVDEFVRLVADVLLAGYRVYCDPDELTYYYITPDEVSDYIDYIEMDDDEFEEEIEGMNDSDVQELREMRDGVWLPKRLDTPDSNIQFTWMEEFAESEVESIRVANEILHVLSGRRPFACFRQVVGYHNLEKMWYAYRDGCCQEYVREELGI